MSDVTSRGSDVVARRPADGLRRRALIATFLVIVQIALGMVVNLYVTVPNHHSGANPSNYFAGSYRSVLWAISSSSATLVIHSLLGLLLIVMSISVAVHATITHIRRVAIYAVLGLLFVVGAAFNGASFLDFAGKDINSLLMALLALGALCSYVMILYVLAPANKNHRGGVTSPSHDQ